jgi:type II secretion system protein C
MQTLLSRLNAATLTSPTVLRRGLWGLVFALIAALGYTSAGTAAWLLGRYLDSHTPAPATAPARAEAATVRQRKPITAFDPILSSNVFHARRSTAAAAAQAPGAAQTAPAAPLRITLSGTFILGKLAFAFIVGPDGRTEQVYQPGECVPRIGDDPGKDCEPSQGKLSRVLADRIVVTFGGQPTVFMLEQNPSVETTPGRPATGPAPPVAAAPSQLPTTRTGNTIEMHLPSAEVEKTFENFAEIVKQARVVPYSKDGVTIGFQIQNIVSGSVFQRIGLQNFDVIKGVNGESLTSADQALRIFTVFRNEKEVVLDVQRQNEAVKLSYVID